MIEATLPFPNIDPVLVHLGPLAIRWYALAYIAGLLLGWWLIVRMLHQKELWKNAPFNGKRPATARACASADRRSGLCGAADRTILRAHRQFHQWRIVGQADRCALGNGVSARARSPAAPSQPALRSGVGRHPAVRDFADGHSRLSLAGPAGPASER